MTLTKASQSLNGGKQHRNSDSKMTFAFIHYSINLCNPNNYANQKWLAQIMNIGLVWLTSCFPVLCEIRTCFSKIDDLCEQIFADVDMFCLVSDEGVGNEPGEAHQAAGGGPHWWQGELKYV